MTLIALPLAILWFGGVILALLDGTVRRVGWLAVGILAAALGATILLAREVLDHGTQEMRLGGWDAGIGIALRIDALGIVFALLSLTVLLCALIFETLEGIGARIFPSLTLFMALGLTGLFFTGDAFNFYVFFEISMIAAYVMASYGETPRQFRAAFLFIVVNLLGSVLFLIAIAGIYHTTGWLDMEKIRVQMPLVAENPAILTATLIFVAFSIKLGLFPFHFWLPAVYTGTRPAVAAILSGALANIGSYGILRFGADLFPRELQEGATVLIVLGTASVIYGGIQAVARHTPNEVLAYSAIGQVGYILIAIAIGGKAGYAAAILYTVLNALNKTLLFLSVNLRGWVIGAAFAVGAFSVAGVPPVAGFLGKLGLFQLAVDGNHPWFVALIFVGGALSFVYMFELYRRRFWMPGEGENTMRSQQVLVVVIALATILIGLIPEPLFQLTQHAASVLPERLP
ncbi:MAG: proton-conducting transporter membrane subunit [Thermomicrobiales bacterium]